ncbi:MAG: ChbG/HpnK family deacetylase, partial [Anaerolineae bacterium]
EFRAQIEAVLNAGLHPTHLDWHCLNNGGRPDIFELSVVLAKEYGLALRVSDSRLTAKLQTEGLPAAEFELLNSFAFDIEAKAARYAEILYNLPAGLSEWAVHPGLDNDQARTTDPAGWPVRASDYSFLMSPQAKQIIQQEEIILVSYSPLQAQWQSQLSKRE